MPNDVTLHVLPEVQPDDPSFGPNYKRRAKAFERYYTAYMHRPYEAPSE